VWQRHRAAAADSAVLSKQPCWLLSKGFSLAAPQRC
jgi:hypothetical protein